MAYRNNYNPYSVHQVNSFGLGMNDILDPSVIADQEISDCENFSVDEDVLTTAPGYILWDDAPQSHPGPYWGGFMFKKSDGYMVDIRQRKGILEYSIDGGNTWSTSFSAIEGLNTVQVRQTDAAGNVSGTTSFSFTVDTTAATPVVGKFTKLMFTTF